jgi:hypothetical protein
LQLINVIYSIGTQGLAVDDLATWAETRKVTVLDCRYSPWSRRPEWCLPRLIQRLGPWYLWCKSFGNLLYNDPRDLVELADPVRGVRIASRLLQSGSICLLCLEADHWRCHRAQVADLIAGATGATVEPLAAADLSPQGRLL